MLASRRSLVWPLVAAIVIARGPALLGQRADSSLSILGSSRIGLAAYGTIQPTPGHALYLTGSFLRAVTEHWQLGIDPTIAGYSAPGNSSLESLLGGTANYVLSDGAFRWYGGGYASVHTSSQETSLSVYGAQVGALYFVSPFVAFRGELNWRQPRVGGVPATTEAVFYIDSYLSNARTGFLRLPDDAVDVAGSIYTYSNNLSSTTGADIFVAPMLASWLQVGLEMSTVSDAFDGVRSGTNVVEGFTRLYAPVSPGAEPFFEGFMATSKVPGGPLLLQNEGVTSYGASAGVRHYVNNGTAFDIGLAWRRYGTGTGTAVNSRAPDELNLEARIVTQIRYTPRW